MQSLLEGLVYWILDSLILTFFREIQSHGRENIPKKGPGKLFLRRADKSLMFE